MRKYRRMVLRMQAANKLHVSPTNFLKKMWERYQIKKYGSKAVAINRARSTHKKNTWKQRIGLVAYNQKKGWAA